MTLFIFNKLMFDIHDLFILLKKLKLTSPYSNKLWILKELTITLRLQSVP